MKKCVMACVALVLPVVGAAAPTWSQIESATWTPAGNTSHKSVGPIAIKTSDIGGLTCYSASADTDTSIAKLMEVVTDVPGSVQWSSAGITKAEVLGKEGDKVWYFQFLDVPGWTMSSDRFWFLEGTVQQDENSGLFRWSKLANGGAYSSRYNAFKAANSSAVEPPINEGGWRFTKKGAQTHVDYFICSDTGGSIPTFVQSAATQKTLPDTIGDAVKEAKRRG